MCWHFRIYFFSFGVSPNWSSVVGVHTKNEMAHCLENKLAFIKRVGKDKCKNGMKWVKKYSDVSI